MYIKSSAYPLIPQLTSNKEIDKVRTLLNTIERKEGKRVRMSYQTANKVGSKNTALELFTLEGKYIEGVVENYTNNPTDFIGKFGVSLDRNNQGTQMEVVDKTLKEKDGIKTTMGTQLLKMLFSDGVFRKTFEASLGQTETGKEMYEGFVELFEDYTTLLNDNVKETLKLNSQGNPLNSFEETMDAFIEFFESQTEDFSEQSKKALAFKTQVNVNRGDSTVGNVEMSYKDFKLLRKAVEEGNLTEAEQDFVNRKLGEDFDTTDVTFEPTTMEFSTPLWLAPEAGKFEAMLMSVVENATVNIKLPGYSYVAASATGYRFQSNLDNVKDKDKVIYLNGYDKNRELQGATLNEDGSLSDTEIMIASKLRDPKTNAILDLYKKKRGKYVYLNENPDGTLSLNEDMN